MTTKTLVTNPIMMRIIQVIVLMGTQALIKQLMGLLSVVTLMRKIALKPQMVLRLVIMLERPAG